MKYRPERRSAGTSKAILAAVAGILAAACQLAGNSRYLGRDGVIFQQTDTDCGAAALTMIFRHFGIETEYDRLRSRLNTGPAGTNMLNLQRAARLQGLLCEGWRLDRTDLPEVPLPAILLFRRHFVVLAGVHPESGATILDPSSGRLCIPLEALASKWKGESLLFCKPGAAASRQSRWFPQSQSFKRRNTP